MFASVDCRMFKIPLKCFFICKMLGTVYTTGLQAYISIRKCALNLISRVSYVNELSVCREEVLNDSALEYT